MKPYEQFVENILGAVRSGQGKDPAAATALIQDALRNAGLMPGAQPGARAPFADLNQGDWREHFKARHTRPHKSTTPDAPGQFLSGSFGNGAGTRRYRVYVPARAASGPRPLVVMLHGCQQDAGDFAAGTAMNRLAEEHGCLVLYPDQDRGANGSNCWNWFDAAHQLREQGEPSLIAGMTRDVLREPGADPDRVYVAGLSAGGAMAAVLGAAYPELYAAVGVHSGLPVGAARDLMSGLHAMKGKHLAGASRTLRRRVPLIVFHGDQDAVVHPSNGAALIRQFLGDGTVREIEERERGHTRTTALDDDGRVVSEHWIVHGAGHAWAGGDPAGSYTDPSGPNASAEMLRFFLAQAN